jgi:hypothetical protein
MMVMNNGMLLLITISPETESAIMHDTQKWANDLTKKLETGKNEAIERERIMQMKREMIAERFPQIWDEMRSAYREHVDAFNAQYNPKRKLACFDSGLDMFMVRPDALNEIAIVKRNSAARTITVIAGKETAIYTPKAVMHGDGGVVLECGSRQDNVEYIVQQSLERGISGVSNALNAS